MFDGRRVVRITGTVTAFRWINPHASIQLDVQGDADAEVQAGPWTVEMQAPSTLMTDGWSRESLTAGDRITLFVNLQRGAVASSSPQRGLYVGAVLADGTSLGQAGPR